MKNKLFVCCFLIILVCEGRAQNNTSPNTADTTVFERDIGKADFHEHLIWARNYLGKLDTLENGFSTLQIRLWYEFDRPSDRQIVVIKRTSHWEAELHTTSWAYTPDSAYLTKRTIRKGVPKIGWDAFVDSLIRLGIATLPDQSQVPGMHPISSSTLHVEIATKDTYRYYHYTYPLEYVKKFETAAKIEKIMQLIERQLGFKRLAKI